jgi:hypothetical protein
MSVVPNGGLARLTTKAKALLEPIVRIEVVTHEYMGAVMAT